MKLRRLIMIAILTPSCLSAQTAGLTGFGFRAGVSTSHQARPTAVMAASLLFQTRRVPIEAVLGTAVADLRSDSGAQHDFFFTANALSSLGSYFSVGAGLGLHSLNGIRPALSGLSSLRLPLAPNNSAALSLTGNLALMRSYTLLSLSLGVQLSPGRGGLQLGEPVHLEKTQSELLRSWDAIVEEVMTRQDAFGLSDAIATNDALLMTFTRDPGKAAAGLARIARVLNGSDDAIALTINAPDPLPLALAATAAGFPAERITRAHADRDITVQARRLPAVVGSRSVQSSHLR